MSVTVSTSQAVAREVLRAIGIGVPSKSDCMEF